MLSGNSMTMRKQRSPLTLIALVLSLALLAANAEEILGVDDFVEYWAAGRLNLTGGNPYDPTHLLPLQRSVGWDDPVPVMMWNPPWTLALVMPFGALPYITGRALWMLAGFAIIIVCADLCWRLYGGPERRCWVGWLCGIFFAPSLLALNMGQIGPLILLGVTGFVYAAEQKRWGPAGAFAALIAVKPHLLYLFWVAWALWALHERRWRGVIALASTLLVATAIPMLWNPVLLDQYIATSTSAPPLYWATPTLGATLRMLFGEERHWLQFTPSVAGLGWFALYWWRRRATWCWHTQMPLLLLASVVTASFGWTFDLVVLVPVIIQAAACAMLASSNALRRASIAAFMVINVLVVVLNQFRVSSFWFFWLAPMLLLLYLLLRRPDRAGSHQPAARSRVDMEPAR